MHQRTKEFFRALCAQFSPEQVRTFTTRDGRQVSYVRPRTLQNRLDDVCGPHGWTTTYTRNERGFTCDIGLHVPVGDAGYEWFHKEDGGGFAGMEYLGGKDKGESDGENDEKSGYTDAFKRTCVAWGPSRYLYGEGVPEYLADLYQGLPAAQPSQWRSQQSQPYQGSSTAPKPDYGFGPPKVNRGIFPWCKKLEGHFTVNAVGIMDDFKRANGFPKDFKEWNDEQMTAGCEHVIGHIKSLPAYKGEFEAAASTGTTATAGPNDVVEKRRAIYMTAKKLMEAEGKPCEEKAEVFTFIDELAQGLSGVGESVPDISTYNYGQGLDLILQEVTRQLDVAIPF